MEGLVRILGMVMTIIPFGVLLYYLFTHKRRNSAFDKHLVNVKDNYGNKGVFIAYMTKVSFGIWFTFLGIFLITYFEDSISFSIFFPFLIIYVICKYFDLKFEKSFFQN